MQLTRSDNACHDDPRRCLDAERDVGAPNRRSIAQATVCLVSPGQGRDRVT